MTEKIRRGEYQVEPVAVADAILRRLREVAEARAEHVGTGERTPASDAPLKPNARSPRAGLANQ